MPFAASIRARPAPATPAVLSQSARVPRALTTVLRPSTVTLQPIRHPFQLVVPAHVLPVAV